MATHHSTPSPGSDSGDGKLSKNAWDAGHIRNGPLQVVSLANNSSSIALTLVSPLSTSIFFGCFAGVATLSQINSISQTNVTWTLLRRKVNGSNTGVELWVGIPTGAPGTSVTASLNAATNGDFCVSEWPASLGLAGTVDQAVDASGSSAFQATGWILPTADKALVFCLFGINNGSIPLAGLTGPFFSLVGGSFMAFGYCFAGKNPCQSSISIQFNGVWANMIISVV
jgi:hypothetical protein